MSNPCGEGVNNVSKSGSKPGDLYMGLGCSVLGPVYKPFGFTAMRTHFFRALSHTINADFTPVLKEFLPIINTPNKDNNILNKPTLLLGGCV